MKQIYSKMLLLIAMILVGGSAWADDVTFTFKTDKDITYTKTGTSGTGSEMIVIKSGVTLSSDKGYTESEKSLSVYKNGSLTITAPGNITAIQLVYNGDVYSFDEAIGEGGKAGSKQGSGQHPATYTPATPAASITFTNSNSGKTDLSSLKVTYTAGTIVPVTGITISKTSATLMATEKLSLTATVLPENASNKLYTWSSNKEEVAKVDDKGVVRALKEGTAIISATTLDGSKVASCTVIVTAKPKPEGCIFYESFDNFDYEGGNDGKWSSISGSKVTGTYDNEGWTESGSVMSGYQCASIRKVDASTPSGLTTPAIGTAVPYGKVVFMAESWGTDGSNFFVDIIGDGKFADGTTTSKVAMLKTGNWTTFTLYVNGLASDSKLRFYAPANKRAFLDEVSVTPITSTEFTMGAAEYATYVTPCAIDFSESGVKAYVVSTVSDENVTLTEVTKVPACEPVVLNAPEGTYTFDAISSADAVTNKMTYSTGDIKYSSTAEKTYYVLALEGDNVVFAPVKSGTIVAGKGYFTVNKEVSSAKTLTFTIEDATSISKVANEMTEGAVFNVAGQRVDANYKGIIIKNGKKYINK